MTVKQKQHLLAFLGYYHADIDGIWGAQSEMATRKFQQDHMEQPDGIFGNETESRIRQVIAEEAAVPEKEETEDFWDEIQYFARSEFACKCGKCGGYPAEPEKKLLMLAERVRKQFGNAALVSSGVRCPSHNAAVGGVSNSRHLRGKAMDFQVLGYSAEQVLAFVQLQPELRYAYAIDGTYVHMDIA